MSDDQKEQRTAILGQVESGLDQAEAHVKRFRRWEFPEQRTGTRTATPNISMKFR